MLRDGNKWDQRIKRARELAVSYPFATEILTFYSKLTAFQQALNSRLESTLSTVPAGARNGHLSAELSPREFEALLPEFKPFLSFLVREGTSALAAFAAGLEEGEPDEWSELLMRLWRQSEREDEESGIVDEAPGELTRTETRAGSARQESRFRRNGDDESLNRFVALAFLQPYVEYLAALAQISPPVARRPVCPFCGSKPVTGVLRPEGDGAKRSLVCSFCYTEWDYLRIGCPACEESRDDRMSVYIASQFEHVRVEACETCKTYIKTVDLTKNGLAIPEVDEVAAIPLTLWAEDKGYKKLRGNMFGS